jgi:di/tricarboxylate transporter
VPNAHAVAVLLTTVVAFFLYTRRWLRMELVSLLILAALLLIFHAFPYEAAPTRLTGAEVLQAFGHPALVAICALMVLGRGLTMTGALDPAVRALSKAWSFSHSLGLLLTLLLAASASAFINDTPVLVLMLPMLVSLSERTGYPLSKTLMPVNLAILTGGMLTSVGTSTNILVLSIATDLGMRPMGIFDFTSIALVALLVALPYLWLVAPRLLADRLRMPSASVREFDARIVVHQSHRRLAGRSLKTIEGQLGRTLPLVELRRADISLARDEVHAVQEGDVIILRDTPAGLRETAAVLGVELQNSGAGQPAGRPSTGDDVSLMEVVIGSASPLIARTLSQTSFAEKFDVAVVGLKRGTEQILRDGRPIEEAPLAAGDVLLVQGANLRLDALKSEPHLMVLDTSLHLPRSPQAARALFTMLAVVVAAATHALPIHVAAFLGVIAMLLFGCVKFDGLGRALSPAVVLLVASSIALGNCLVSTGAAAWIALGVTKAVQSFSPAVQIAAFMAFSALLTNFVSNSAAAAVGTPIAVATAHQLGAPLEPFVLAILFGANLSFATPMAYQTNLLIMNAAGYDFRDFVKVGLPLVAIMLVALSVALAVHYDL